MPPSLEEFQTAARVAAESIKPVLQLEQGTGWYQPIGSAVLVRGEDDRGAIVTAEHVVARTEAIRIVVAPDGTMLTWPRPYFRLEALSDDIPTADIAFAMGTFELDGPALTLDSIVTDLRVIPEMQFLVVGFPNSRAKYRPDGLSAEWFFAVCPATVEGTYDTLTPKRDPRVHIVVDFDRGAMTLPSGDRQTGPMPEGVSGGVLFLPLVIRDAQGLESIQLRPAGVLVSYHRPPKNVLVATRFDCLIDAIAPRRPETARTHRAVLSEGVTS